MLKEVINSSILIFSLLNPQNAYSEKLEFIINNKICREKCLRKIIENPEYLFNEQREIYVYDISKNQQIIILNDRDQIRKITEINSFTIIYEKYDNSSKYQYFITPIKTFP